MTYYCFIFAILISVCSNSREAIVPVFQETEKIDTTTNSIPITSSSSSLQKSSLNEFLISNVNNTFSCADSDCMAIKEFYIPTNQTMSCHDKHLKILIEVDKKLDKFYSHLPQQSFAGNVLSDKNEKTHKCKKIKRLFLIII